MVGIDVIKAINQAYRDKPVDQNAMSEGEMPIYNG
jgi:hypothetical protein